MVNPLELTFYIATGYNPSDEPSSDAVINLNEHWTMPLLLKEYDPSTIQAISVHLSDDELRRVDYLKITDTVTRKRWYYYVVDHQRRNEKVIALRIALDHFSTVGLANISFFGNIVRRSLSANEIRDYPLLPEPWAPRRPLKTRRVILDLNINKTIRLPSHISVEFEEAETVIGDEQTIHVPNSPLGGTTFADSLAVQATVPMGYLNAATDTEHTINTPWGSISYKTPYEQYFNLSGTALNTFLAKAKMYNALDLVAAPYYLPNPGGSKSIVLSELSNPQIKNPKASRHYATITIRSLAANSSQTYSETNTDLQYDQSLTVIIVPDKNGGIYVLPATLRDTGLNAYTYLDGVYSPFETIVYNAVGDTPAKFAADGTLLLNTALNNLFQTYINKVNAMQVQGMQAKYFKDVGAVKGVVMSFVSDLLGSTSTSVTTTEGYYQNSTSDTNIPTVTQTSSQSQVIPDYTQTQTQTTSNPSYRTTHSATINNPATNGTQTSTTSNPSRSQTQAGYTQQTTSGGTTTTGSIKTTIDSHTTSTSTTVKQDANKVTSSTNVDTPSFTQSVSGSIKIPRHTIATTSSGTTNSHTQKTTQSTWVEPQITRSTTTQEGAQRGVSEGNDIAIEGANTVYEIDAWGTLRNMIFGGYRNEMHSFMLGNINDYLNRWVSIQNDMHNGKVANLFKNITLVGDYADHNRVAGKYEILIASLQPEDEHNFDLFLDHFGHAVDEYSNALVVNARDNYNYVMVGDDAFLYNPVQQNSSASILNQFRTGVRVWNKLIRPENF